MAGLTTSFNPDFAAPSEWAAMYRAAGMQVVPARYPMRDATDKRPALSTWREFQTELVSTTIFTSWFPVNATPNMDLITGSASGNIFVIDLDEQKHPEAALWWRGVLVINNHGREPETWGQVTGGGGRQLLFRAPIGWHAPTNRTPIGVDIRGQGGFAMLPPSQHLSGKEYAWAPGAGPWEVDIEDAPDWLLDAVDELVDQYGGDQGNSTGGERTPSPSTDFNAFGVRIDRREDALTKWVWKSVLELHRATGGNTDERTAEEQFSRSLEGWLRHAKTRLGGVDNAAGLERECRGESAFRVRWHRAMGKWGGKVAEQAAERPKAQERAPEPPQPLIDPETGEIIEITRSASEFVQAFTPPEYLIDGVMQRGYLYSLTARTGHGKTAVSMFLAQCIARGLPVHGKEVKQGTVLLLAGENPDDVRARYITMADACGFDPEALPMRFIAGVVDIAATLPTIKAEAIPDLVLVIVDTAAAYFKGDDSNSNAQQGAYARLLRELTFLPGKPAVLVPCHPVKNASAENLAPAGGGAFLNEVDGNLTLWANAERQATLHWQGKFRGPEFEPMAFEIETITSERVKDSKGRLMPSVMAKPVGEMQIEFAQQRTEEKENRILFAVHQMPRASLARIAVKTGLVTEDGRPQKSTVGRLLQRLLEEKMVERTRGKFRITPKGKKEIGVSDDTD